MNRRMNCRHCGRATKHRSWCNVIRTQRKVTQVRINQCTGCGRLHTRFISNQMTLRIRERRTNRA